jgi:hypothetical protein
MAVKKKRHFHFDIPKGARLVSLGNFPVTVSSGEFEWYESSEKTKQPLESSNPAVPDVNHPTIQTTRRR